MKLRRGQTLLLVRALLYLALIALTVLSLQRIAVVIAPVATGLFLAYLLNPVVERLERKRVPRPIAIGLLFLGACSVFVVIALLVPPLLASELTLFGQRFQSYQARLQTVVLPYVRDTLHLPMTASLEDIVTNGLPRLQSALSSASLDVSTALGGALATASGLLRLLLAVLLTPVFAIYFLSDYFKIQHSFDSLIPARHRNQVVALLSEINQALASWVRGQFTVMVTLGTLYATGLALTGIPLGFAVGILTGLMAFVPYVGVLVGLVLALTCALFDPNPAGALAGVGLTFGSVQLLDALFITPRILGGRVGLSPVAVIFALSLGGELLGYAGVILAVPSAAVCKVLLSHARRSYFASAFYTGELGESGEPVLENPALAIVASDENIDTNENNEIGENKSATKIQGA